MQAPQTDFNKVVQILKEEFNITDLGQIFSEFDPKPIASASLAQVHKARLRTG
jgi:predicted unusual protein kinase regulating ubiquinone biosynthesis (AarF/ABC1/UbiB family)